MAPNLPKGLLPNLALMKLSAYHKARGDEVSMTGFYSAPDLVYISCVFTWNRPKARGIAKMYPQSEVICGGHGVALGDVTLPDDIEHLKPDYSLYPWMDFSMGYTSRGCIRHCGFCDVWKMEGPIHDQAPINEFLEPGHKRLVLLDNNLLASPKWRQTLQYIIDNHLQVNFCQGLDIRLVNDEVASYLTQIDARTVSFKTPMFHFAFDSTSYESSVERGVEILLGHGLKARNLTFFVLCGYDEEWEVINGPCDSLVIPSTLEDCMHRFQVIRNLGANAYIMKYQDRRDLPWLNKLDRWVNRHLYKKCAFTDYNTAIRGHAHGKN